MIGFGEPATPQQVRFVGPLLTVSGFFSGAIGGWRF